MKSQRQTSVQQADAALQERLKRVMGEPSGSTERRVFVGGMPFGYEVSMRGSFCFLFLLL